MKKVLLAGAALALVMSGPAWAEIKIGVQAPITGQYAAFGEQLRSGAELAVAHINAAGGVLGEQLALEIGDDACEGRQAVSVANHLVGQGVVFVVGGYCSGASIPASAVYADEEVIQISPASTNPLYTEDRPGPGIFRMCGRDDHQAQVAGPFILERFPDAKVAFIHDRTSYGQGLSEATRDAYIEAGGEPALFEAFTPGERDYNSLVAKLVSEGIGVIHIGGYHTESGLITRQLREAGSDAVVIGGDALVTDEFWAITGDLGEGTLMTFSPDPRKNPDAAPLVEEFRAGGVEPEGYVLYTYAAVQAWKDAVEAAGSVDFEAVVDALNTGTFQTVLGESGFDDVGDVTLPGYVFYEWKGGTYDYLEN